MVYTDWRLLVLLAAIFRPPSGHGDDNPSPRGSFRALGVSVTGREGLQSIAVHTTREYLFNYLENLMVV